MELLRGSLLKAIRRYGTLCGWERVLEARLSGASPFVNIIHAKNPVIIIICCLVIKQYPLWEEATITSAGHSPTSKEIFTSCARNTALSHSGVL